jgi:hypothetical protein
LHIVYFNFDSSLTKKQKKVLEPVDKVCSRKLAMGKVEWSPEIGKAHEIRDYGWQLCTIKVGIKLTCPIYIKRPKDVALLNHSAAPSRRQNKPRNKVLTAPNHSNQRQQSYKKHSFGTRPMITLKAVMGNPGSKQNGF